MPILSIDEYEGLKLLRSGLDEWLTEHEGDIREWAHKNLSIEDTESFIRDCHKDRTLGPIMRLIARQMNRPAKIKLKDILEPFFTKKGQLHVIVGRKRGGKTLLMYLLAEQLAKQQQIWLLGPPVSMPDFIAGRTTRLERIPPNSTVLIDDAGIDFFSRVRDMEKDDVIRMLAVLAHTNKNLILNVQNTKILDVGFMRLCDGIWFKSYSVFQTETERAAKISDQLAIFMPNNVSQVLYYDNQKIYRFNYPVPRWWDENKYSKTYASFESEIKMWRFAVELLDELRDDQIIDQLTFKGAEVDIMQIATLRMLAREYDLNKLSDRQLLKTVSIGFDETPIDLLLEGRQLNTSYDFGMMAGHTEIWKDRMAKNPELELKSRRCVNSVFLKDLKSIIANEMHILVQVRGMTGSGKSWFAMAIAEAIGKLIKKPFSADNTCFSPEEISERVKAVKNKDTIVLEEVTTRRVGIGSGRAIWDIENLTQTLRQSQLSFIYTSPEQGPYLSHYDLEMFGIDKKADVARALLYGPREVLPLGFITFSKPSDKLLHAYNKKKQTFMKQIKERTISGKDHLVKLVGRVLEDPRWDSCRNLSMKKTLIALMYPHLSTGEVEMVRDMCSLEDFNEKAKPQQKLNPPDTT